MNEATPAQPAREGGAAPAAGKGGRTAGRSRLQDDHGSGQSRTARGRPPGTGRAGGGRGERKAVLNVTISESLAEEVRMAAAQENSTISSVVERALAEQVRWELIRREGLAAIDAYYQEHGYPTEDEMAAAEDQVAEEERLIDEARAALAAEGASRRRGGGRSRGGRPA